MSIVPPPRFSCAVCGTGRAAPACAVLVLLLGLALYPASAPAAAQTRPGIQDRRLQADSTLFLYEWPALNALQETLSRLRPALESGALGELAQSQPVVEDRFGRLMADSLPSLIARRREEVIGRMIVLRNALELTEQLAPAALAAPPPAPDDSAAGHRPAWGGPAPARPGDSLQPARPAPPVSSPGPAPGAERPVPLLRPGGDALPLPAGAQTPEAHRDTLERGAGGLQPGADSLQAVADTLAAEPVDPVEVYLEAWRDVHTHVEALVHRVRDPAGSSAE